jgi:hypothetical protein
MFLKNYTYKIGDKVVLNAEVCNHFVSTHAFFKDIDIGITIFTIVTINTYTVNLKNHDTGLERIGLHTDWILPIWIINSKLGKVLYEK